MPHLSMFHHHSKEKLSDQSKTSGAAGATKDGQKNVLVGAVGAGTSGAAPAPGVKSTGEKGLPSTPQPGNEIDKDLADAWTSANRTPTVSKADKVLLMAEGAVSSIQEKQDNMVVEGVKTVLEQTGALDKIEEGINSFVENSEVFMKALDAVGQLHPFIGLAVLAFKAAYTLEMKRRDNDKKIISLHMEMRDMMEVLIPLKNVKDAEALAPDGTSIKSRMQVIIKKVAEDIKACANACDTYSKKGIIAKVLKGPVWEPKLLGFVETFAKRRTELEFSLTIHTSLGVDSANDKIDVVIKMQKDMDAQLQAKMELMMTFFATKAVPKEQKELEKYVEAKGGVDACLNDDQLLEEVTERDRSLKPPGKSTIPPGRVNLGAVKGDLDDPDTAISDNMAAFNKKFDEQSRQITEELTRVIQRDGDRVISAITSGPHDRIVDPDVYKVWKDMGWRGSVKTRTFVLTLRDYFFEKGQNHGDNNGKPSDDSDDWALSYLDPVRLQSISEAFDQDASGFITVSECNLFTQSRPIGWSLPRWLAYWAIGWPQSMMTYGQKIGDLLIDMFRMLPDIRVENAAKCHDYLKAIDKDVATLQQSMTDGRDYDEEIQKRFQSYVDSEEVKLKGRLESVAYDVENMSAFLIGTAKIEKSLLPMLYLILQRHYKIFKVCCTQIVDQSELEDSSANIAHIVTEVETRISQLRFTFEQQKLKLDEQFKVFANGLFKYMYKKEEFWTASHMEKELGYLLAAYGNSQLDEDAPFVPANVLKYPIRPWPDIEAYVVDSAAATPAALPDYPNPLKAVLGKWHGYYYNCDDARYAISGIETMTLLSATPAGDDLRFRSDGYVTSEGDHYMVTGELHPTESGTIEVKFRWVSIGQRGTWYHRGVFDPEAGTLIGTRGLDEAGAYGAQDIFEFRRTSGDILPFRPGPAVFEESKPRALWSFAIAAIAHQVKIRLWSKSLLLERRTTRQRIIQLSLPMHRTDQAYDGELEHRKHMLNPADNRFYYSLAALAEREYCASLHDLVCQIDSNPLIGVRVVCVMCQAPRGIDSLNICERLHCLSKKWVRTEYESEGPHLPTHTMVKLRRIFHDRFIGQLKRDAVNKLEDARKYLAPLPGSPTVEKTETVTHTEGEPEESECVDDRIFQRICTACGKDLVDPFWFCMLCYDPTFICHACDASKSPAKIPNNTDHDHTHDLVLFREASLDPISMENRLITLEADFKGKVAKLDSKVEDRIGELEKKMEAMTLTLNAILAKLGH